ncbi:MAG: NnrS family protein [Polyangiaceae bacterium]|nr:NnrS family protein [Polyangiaceae bacterium]
MSTQRSLLRHDSPTLSDSRSSLALGEKGCGIAAAIDLAFIPALMVAGLVRVIGPLFESMYIASIVVAGVLWSLAFVLYLVVYLPILIAPRVDGRPG